MNTLPRVASLESWMRDARFEIDSLLYQQKAERHGMIGLTNRVNAIEKHLGLDNAPALQTAGDKIMSLTAPLAEGAPRYAEEEFSLLDEPRVPLPAPAPAEPRPAQHSAEATAPQQGLGNQ